MTISTTNGDAPNSPEASTYSAYIKEELRRYDEHLRDVRGLSAGTRKDRMRIIALLLEGKFKHREVVFARMQPDDVRQFLATRLAMRQTFSNASQHATALRSYLRYRATCGDSVGKLAAVIQNPVHWKLASLPRALKQDEIEHLLESFSTRCRWQKRSYAIIRCALDLGLRAGEIARLMICDIDWSAGTVRLRGTKSLREDILLTYRGRAIRPKTAGQKRYVDAIREHTITFGIGPAGTGKTYHTINKALAILDPAWLAEHETDRQALKTRFDELVKEGRIDFVTFHQSFSYEDFVEGIRAESDGDSGQLTYDVVDGVFKRMCDAVAAKVTRSDSHEAMTLEGRRVWKMSLGNTKGDDAHIFDDCIEEGVIRLGYGGAHDYSQCKSREEVQALLEQSTGKIDNAYDYTVTSVMTLVNRMKVGDLVVVTDGNFKFRAIGEIKGDYRRELHPDYDDGYAQVRPVKWLCQFSPSLPCSELINGRFSQMTLYELKAPTLIPEKLLALVNATASQAGSQSEPGDKIIIFELKSK